MKTEIDKKASFYKNEKDYMNSYHWNYLTLELVDFIELKLKEANGADGDGVSKNRWRYFMEYCLERGLNRRVIKKMIEFSVGQAFECETDLINHAKFRSLKSNDIKITSAAPNNDHITPATTADNKLPIAELNYNFSDIDF